LNSGSLDVEPSALAIELSDYANATHAKIAYHSAIKLMGRPMQTFADDKGSIEEGKFSAKKPRN